MYFQPAVLTFDMCSRSFNLPLPTVMYSTYVIKQVAVSEGGTYVRARLLTCFWQRVAILSWPVLRVLQSCGRRFSRPSSHVGLARTVYTVQQPARLKTKLIKERMSPQWANGQPYLERK